MDPIPEPTQEDLLRMVEEMEAFSVTCGKFVPHAVYDKLLDAVRVNVENASVTEKPISLSLVLNEKNHREDGDPVYVGFSIESVRYMCVSFGLTFNNKTRIEDILDLVSRVSPESAQVIKNIAIPMLRTHNLKTIDFLD